MSRFLITRLSAIGDCIETLPLAVEIKRQIPGSHITWIVDCGVDSILKTQPYIDQVIRMKKGFLKRPREVLALRKSLRSQKFDFAIDPQGLLKSSLLGWLSGAKRRIGFDTPQSREGSAWLYHDRIKPTKDHLVDRQLELLQPIGISIPETSQGKFDWFEPAEIGSETERVLSSLALEPGKYLCVNPPASWPSKVWPKENYSQLIQQVSSRFPIKTLVLWGNDSEGKPRSGLSRTPRLTRQSSRHQPL